MSYPPGNPGYQPTAPTNQFAAPTQQFAKQPEPGGTAASKLPLYLSIAVAVLGLAVYFFSYGPFVEVDVSGSLPRLPGLPQEAFDVPNQVVNGGGVLSNGGGFGLVALFLAALIAGAGVLAKQKPRHAIVAVLAVFGFLVLVLQLVTVSGGNSSAGWALITVVALAFLQAAAAVANLLLDAGVITAPEPKPRYDQHYGGGYAPPPYYGQQGGQPGQHQGQPQQRPGYAPQQYGYGGGAAPGGYPGSAPQSGPPTPPTGFPAYGQPQPAGSTESTGPQAPVQPSQAQPTQQTQQSPPQQAGPPPS